MEGSRQYHFDMSKGTQEAGKRRSERIRRKKKALFKSATKLGTDDKIDVAVIVYQHGRYYVSVSTGRESWPPSIEDIVSITDSRIVQNLINEQRSTFPQPKFYRAM